MIRPPLEVADIVRTYGAAFVKRHCRWLTALHLKVLRTIAVCRTAALGGHIEQCDRCGQRAISYNSCLNRHCPKCQAAARQLWLANRSAELLPVPYFHVVFTLPHILAPLALQNKALMYGLLFRAAAETLLQIAADPQRLGAAQIRVFWPFSILGARLFSITPICIAWSREEGFRRIIVDGFPADASFFLPVKVLSVVFRGKFLDALERAFKKTQAYSCRSTHSSSIPSRVRRSAMRRRASRLGRLCQATLCRARAGPNLSLSLYSPHCHRQLSTRSHGRR